jgi:hypothetical protein
MAELVRELVCPDPVVRSRAADALEKATAGRADLLNPYKEVILRVAAGSLQQEVRWHMAQIVPRLPLTRRQVRGAFSILRGYLRDRSVIVRVCALQTMVDLALRDPALQAPAKAMVAEACRTGTAAIRARVRKLLVLLEEKADGL